MKLINLGLLFSAAICANTIDTVVDLTDTRGNYTIMGKCEDSFGSYGRSETGPMVKGRKYRIGTVKLCDGSWKAGLMHWKSYHHGWPDNPIGTWSLGISQDTKCNAKNKAFVRLENDGRMFDDERGLRYAYTDDIGKPRSSGSALCTLFKCYHDLEFVPTTRTFKFNGKIYNGYKWRKNSVSSRNFYDLKCKGDDVVATGDIQESFFILLY
jgi:hypothetical protein